jgi:tryptophan-associated transmembrane protein
LLAAVALWVSSRLTWATQPRRHPGTDAVTQVARTGAELAPLVPLAVLALAGVAAAVALTGWPRRVLGVVLAGAGLAAAGLGVFLGTANVVPWGRFLAVLAGALLVLAGTVLVLRGGRLPRLGARYEVPGGPDGGDDTDSDLWHALSQGKDPTTNDG